MDAGCIDGAGVRQAQFAVAQLTGSGNRIILVVQGDG